MAQFVLAAPSPVWVVQARSWMSDGTIAFTLASEVLAMAPVVWLLLAGGTV